MAGLFRMRFIAGNSKGEIFPLEKPETSIGRDVSCDVVLSDLEVSRRHAKIIIRSSGFSIQDTGSTNGTFINDQQAAGEVELQPGDVISFGSTASATFEHAVFSGEEIHPVPIPRKSDPGQRVHQKQGADNKPQQKSLNLDHWREKLTRIINLSRMPNWLLIALIILIVLLMFCILSVIVIDLTDSWCRLFAGIFNQIQPMSCP